MLGRAQALNSNACLVKLQYKSQASTKGQGFKELCHLIINSESNKFTVLGCWMAFRVFSGKLRLSRLNDVIPLCANLSIIGFTCICY